VVFHTNLLVWFRNTNKNEQSAWNLHVYFWLSDFNRGR